MFCQLSFFKIVINFTVEALPDKKLLFLKLLGQHGQEVVELVDVDVPGQLFTERCHGVDGALL